jgi:two-component sensor histidine kinase
VALDAQCQGLIPSNCIEPLTLIANELVTNAAKHAFRGKSSEQIKLSYQQRGAGWRFGVHDDGNGMSNKKTYSFGSQLIETLAASLHAHVTYRTEGGTEVDILCGDWD